MGANLPTHRTLAPNDVTVGDTLPELIEEITLPRVVMGAATTGTYFDGHIDPDYARRQGRRDVYLATGPIAGLLDRYVLGWAGPEAFLAKRKLAMRGSICAGDTVTFTGTVSEAGEKVVLDVVIQNQLGEDCVTAQLTVRLPQPGEVR